MPWAISSSSERPFRSRPGRRLLAGGGRDALDSAQFIDEQSGRFFLRTIVRSETGAGRQPCPRRGRIGARKWRWAA